MADDLEALHWELRCAQQTIIDLMPDEIGLLLTSYVQHPPAQRAAWLERTVETLLDTAATLPRPTAPSASGAERVYCPLCRHGRQDPYAQGFSHPEGLRRHLTGDYGGRRCRVLVAAHALASQHWDAMAKDARGAASTSPIPLSASASVPAANVVWRYQTGPECEGVLLSEHSGQPRSEEELAMAEHRLTQLGFVRLRSARSIVSYTRAVEGHVIYADPRASGVVWFHCYRRSTGLTLGWERRFPSFKLRDGLKLAVLDKFEAWLDMLLRSHLSPLPGAVAPRVAAGPGPAKPVSTPVAASPVAPPVRRAAR